MGVDSITANAKKEINIYDSGGYIQACLQLLDRCIENRRGKHDNTRLSST